MAILNNKTPPTFGDRVARIVLIPVVSILLVLLIVGIATYDSNVSPLSEPIKQFENINPNRMQSSVRAMADFMVKDDNLTGLRIWAQSLNVSSPEFSSATTLHEEIRRASDDFAIYRDSKELTRLIETLSNTDKMFIDTLGESIH